MGERFSVQEVILSDFNYDESHYYFILDNEIPFFIVNKWLKYKGTRSINTSIRYAQSICRFLNYLDSKNIDYKDVKKKNIIEYIEYVLYTDKDGNITIKANVTYSTASNYLSAIKEFYRWVEDFCSDEINLMFEKKKKRSNNECYLYGQIWDMNSEEILMYNIKRMKPSREYIKWYTTEQIQAICSNFLTIRDNSIFLLTLEGMRIDEVLSLTLDSYDECEGIVRPNRSKSSIERVVVLKKRTQKILDDYLYTERDNLESEMGILNEFMFINLRKGKSQGEVLGYRNYLTILKNAAKKAGLSPEIIRSHSGRSTRTMELLRKQTENKDLTDEQIDLIMGWSSEKSKKPYVNTKDERLMIDIARKINENEENHGNNKNE